MSQSTVFSQVIKLISRTQFESIVHKHNGDKGLRSLNCWTWFGALLFGQLTGHDSIRAIERIFATSDSKMQKLGLGPVRRSTLADANRTRPLEVLDDLFHLVLRQAQTVAPKKNGFRFHGQVLALDSTTIELCLSLSPWAKFHHDKVPPNFTRPLILQGTCLCSQSLLMAELMISEQPGNKFILFPAPP
jgi:hypothetical protein